MTNYRKGSRVERKVMDRLDQRGWASARTAGSHGLFDVIAWNERGFRLIQVKAGRARNLTAGERRAVLMNPVPPNATKELWRWKDRAPEPQIEILP